MINKALKAMNLASKESEIYLILLKSGLLSIQEISNKTRINRTYCYEIIKSMQTKGVISSANQNRGKKYSAVNPKDFLLLIKEKEEIVKKALPELEKFKSSQINVPKINSFEGNKGVKSAMAGLLKTNQEILGFSSKEFIEYMDLYLPNFAKERAKKKISIKLLLHDTKWTREWLSEFNSKKELREAKFHKYENDFKSTIYISKNTVLIILLSEKNISAISIEDNNYALTQKIIFKQLWKRVK